MQYNTIKLQYYWNSVSFPPSASVDWMRPRKPFRGGGVICIGIHTESQFNSSVHSWGVYIPLTLQDFLSTNFKHISSCSLGCGLNCWSSLRYY